MTEPGALRVDARGDQEIVLTRAFNAPRDQVFEAITKPDLLRQWMLGPDGWTMQVCEVDLQNGGAYHFEWRDQTQKEMGVRGVYREVSRPTRLVHTEKFDQAPGEAIVISDLDEREGMTVLTMTIKASKEMRDQMIKQGMESGVARSYERLDEILESESGVAKPGERGPNEPRGPQGERGWQDQPNRQTERSTEDQQYGEQGHDRDKDDRGGRDNRDRKNQKEDRRQAPAKNESRP